VIKIITDQEFSDTINKLEKLVVDNKKQENTYLVRVKDLVLDNLAAMFSSIHWAYKFSLEQGKPTGKNTAIDSFQDLNNYGITIYNKILILEKEKFVYKNRTDDSIVLPNIHLIATDIIYLNAEYQYVDIPNNERSIISRILGNQKQRKTDAPPIWTIRDPTDSFGTRFEIYDKLQLEFNDYVVPLYANDPIYKTVDEYITQRKLKK